MRVFNVSDEVCSLAADTVVVPAKPFIDATSVKPYEENHQNVVSKLEKSTSKYDNKHFKAHHNCLGRYTEDLTDSETERLQKLLCNYQHGGRGGGGGGGGGGGTWVPHIRSSTALQRAMYPNLTTALVHLSKET